MYAIETKLAAKSGWHTPTEAQAYYKKYSRDGITVHWWNSPDKVKDSDHDNIVRYQNDKAKRGVGSVNYVLSNTKITLCVHPDNVAWTSHGGNPTTVSIEFSPHLNAEGYKKAGWLIKELESRYKKTLKLYQHKYWYATACPGTLDLNRMRKEADKWKRGDYNPKPPTPAPKIPELVWRKLTAKENKEFICNKEPTNLWDFNNLTWNMVSKGKYSKGHRVTAYGTVLNKTLNATYYLTEYSYTKGITNGFNAKDLDAYAAPAPKPDPVPEPPKEQQPVPDPPMTPKPIEERVAILEALVQRIVDFLSSIFSNFKKG